ncbi:hypothetical protein BDQ17DRAFT_1265746, partial [Cyathus striatus]
ALKLQKEVLDKRRRAIGELHPDTLVSMHNLAETYSRLGQWKEAEELQIQVIYQRKDILGSEHPDTLESISLNQLLQFKQKERRKLD